MFVATLRRLLRRASRPLKRPRPATRSPHRGRFQPLLESLETRSLPSVYIVTNLGDEGVGTGQAGDLRYCITQANTNDEPSNQIVFQPGLTGTISLTSGPFAINKNLEIDGPGQNLLTVSGNHQSGVLDITSDPRVQVVMVSDLTIADGTGIVVDDRNVGGGIYNDHADLTLSNVAVVNNAVANLGGVVGQGAGIYNNIGTLTLNSSTVSGNNAVTAATATIRNFGGTVTLNSSTVSGNTTGGIYSSGSLAVRTVIRSSTIADNDGLGLGIAGSAAITDSTISGNTQGGAVLEGGLDFPTPVTISHSAIVGNTGTGLLNSFTTLTITSSIVSGNSVEHGYRWGGGGIETQGRTSIIDSVISDNVGSGIVSFNQLTISGSTISGNSGRVALGQAGGLEVVEGTAQIVNSTFSGNTSARGSGGIGVMARGFLELTSVTITGNAANSTDPLSGGGGLSVVDRSGTGRALLRNTLVAGNSTASAGPDVLGAVTSLGYNLVGAADDSQGWGPRDLTGDLSSPLDPHLGPLQDNGGPTPTHALLAGSPAINRGDPALLYSLDQRGTIRFHAGSNPPVDIGAFDANLIHSMRLEAPADVVAGQPFPITVTALDNSGHTASTYLGRIHFSSTDLDAVLPDDYTFTAADGGRATFTVTLLTAGHQQLQVDTLGSIDHRATATVNVDPPAVAVPGQSFQFTVTAVDPWGNVASTYTGTMHFSSTDLFAQLPDDYIFVGDDAGSHTLSATLLTSGHQAIAVDDIGGPRAPQGSVSVRVVDSSAAGDFSDAFWEALTQDKRFLNSLFPGVLRVARGPLS